MPRILRFKFLEEEIVNSLPCSYLFLVFIRVAKVGIIILPFLFIPVYAVISTVKADAKVTNQATTLITDIRIHHPDRLLFAHLTLLSSLPQILADVYTNPP